MSSASGAEGLPDHELRRLRAVAADDVELESLVRRRLAGEPLQYLEGTAPFGPLDLVVDPRVLVPRPETEQLFDLATRLAADPGVVLDLCTGSGALALALKHRFPAARVLGADISGEALEVAAENRARLGIAVELVRGDLFEPVPLELRGRIDLVVANPPYLSEAEWEGAPADVRREPRQALVAGPEGTEVLDRIAAEVGAWLAPGGWLACEIGETQAEHCRRAFARSLERVEVLPDLVGRDRHLVGIRG